MPIAQERMGAHDSEASGVWVLRVLRVLGEREGVRSVLRGEVVGQAGEAAGVQHSGLADSVVLAAAQREPSHFVSVSLGAFLGSAVVWL